MKVKVKASCKGRPWRSVAATKFGRVRYISRSAAALSFLFLRSHPNNSSILVWLLQCYKSNGVSRAWQGIPLRNGVLLSSMVCCKCRLILFYTVTGSQSPYLLWAARYDSLSAAGTSLRGIFFCPRSSNRKSRKGMVSLQETKPSEWIDCNLLLATLCCYPSRTASDDALPLKFST